MRGVADCRKCRYFIPIDDVLNEYGKYDIPVHVLEELAHARFTLGADVKGLCVKRMKPVTYYRGHCRHYEPKRKQLKQLTLNGGVAWIE